MSNCGLRCLQREFSRYKEHDELQRSMEERVPQTPTPSFASCLSDSCSAPPPRPSSPRGRSPAPPVPDNRCCSNLMERISCSVATSWKGIKMLYRKVSSDRFTWQLFKSIIFFTLGLKLFNDMARHMAKDNK